MTDPSSTPTFNGMRWTAALLVVFALCASDAHARERHEMTFGFAATVAVDYWAARHVLVPCEPHVRLLTWQDVKGWHESGYDPDMLAEVATCTVLIHPRAEWYRQRHEYAWIYCKEIMHEFGHLAGLEHDRIQNVVPWGCTHRRRFLRQHQPWRLLNRGTLGTAVLRRVVRLDRRCRYRVRAGRCVRTSR